MTENVRPSHYRVKLADGREVECLDLIDALQLSFGTGNVLKYLWRAGRKTPDALEDLKKARTYLDLEIQKREVFVVLPGAYTAPTSTPTHLVVETADMPPTGKAPSWLCAACGALKTSKERYKHAHRGHICALCAKKLGGLDVGAVDLTPAFVEDAAE